MNCKMKNANTSTGVNVDGKLFAVPAWSTGGETDETTLHWNLLFVKLFTALHSALQTKKYTHMSLLTNILSSEIQPFTSFEYKMLFND